MTNVSKMTNKFWTAEKLAEMEKGEFTLSRPTLEKFVAMGLLEPKYVKLTEGKGRPAKHYELTGKARGYLAISRSWKRHNVRPELMTRGELEAEVLRLRKEVKEASSVIVTPQA